MSLHYLGNVNHGNCLFSDSGKLGTRRDHPCLVSGLHEIVLGLEFHQNLGSKFALSP